jgi:hypothetical protein
VGLVVAISVDRWWCLGGVVVRVASFVCGVLFGVLFAASVRGERGRSRLCVYCSFAVYGGTGCEVSGV